MTLPYEVVKTSDGWAVRHQDARQPVSTHDRLLDAVAACDDLNDQDELDPAAQSDVAIYGAGSV